jgi:hypothetical protein
MKLKAPDFLSDLYRDLRDRKLLVPVIALVVALVVVPVTLSKPADVVPPPAAAGVSGEAAATESAVLAEGVSVRDYRERLEGLTSRNPFRQGVIPLPKSTGLNDTSGELSEGAPGAGGISGAEPAASAVGASGGSEPSQTTSSAPQPPRIEPRFFTRRIDVTVGPVGAAVERDGIKQLSMLPSKSKPVVAFLGVTEHGDRAVFGVSPDVTEVRGDGKCTPGLASCAYLVLEVGDDARLDYAPDANTYRLKLRKIRNVSLKGPPALQP